MYNLYSGSQVLCNVSLERERGRVRTHAEPRARTYDHARGRTSYVRVRGRPWTHVAAVARNTQV